MIIKTSYCLAAVVVGFVCLAGFKVNSTVTVAGTYDLKLSDEAVSLCEWLQASVPAGRLVLSEDGEYRLERYIEGRRMISEGDFEIDRSEVILNRNNTRKTLRGSVTRNRVTIEGLSFEREGFGEEEVTRREVPPVRELPRQEPRRELPPLEIPRRELPREAPRDLDRGRSFSATGKWVVQNSNGRIDPSIRFTFSSNGRFSFTGMGSTSSGTYELLNDRISLRYQEVDGQRVEFPYNGKAYIQGDGFRIDNFHYVRE